LSDKDFISIDESELVLPRQANGDLPVIRLLRLAPGSALIDKGVDVGYPFHGVAPDLGAFESTKE
jgi:pectate lyase